jgi:hypothetical protein
MKASSGLAFSSMRSDLISSSSATAGGSSLAHRRHSPKRASKSCDAVGAVTTTLTGTRVSMNQSMAHEATVDLPVPWPERTLILRSPAARSSRRRRCHGSGVTPRTSSTKATGAAW